MSSMKPSIRPAPASTLTGGSSIPTVPRKQRCEVLHHVMLMIWANQIHGQCWLLERGRYLDDGTSHVEPIGWCTHPVKYDPALHMPNALELKLPNVMLPFGLDCGSYHGTAQSLQCSDVTPSLVAARHLELWAQAQQMIHFVCCEVFYKDFHQGIFFTMCDPTQATPTVNS